MNTSPHPSPGTPCPDPSGVEAFEMVARDVIGMTLRSLEQLGGKISVPQFRLLLTLHTLGKSRSAKVAAAMGLAASSVSRLAERLAASGYIVRGADARHRGVVTLELSAQGRAAVDEVVNWRKGQLRRMLAAVDPSAREAVADALRVMHAAAGFDGADGVPETAVAL